MTAPDMTASRASELVARFGVVRVLVVGDVMLDRFIVGRVTRISPEAPVPVVQFQSEHVRLGGAANVANNLAALGGRASLVGIVGRDAAADRIRSELADARIDVAGLVTDPSRPTTEKVRVVTERNQQVARIDYERDADADGSVEREVVARARALAAGAGALLVSDYLKGAITRAVVEALLAAHDAGGSMGPPLLVDPKIPHLSCYAGATLVTPNHHEAETATHIRIRSDADARDAAQAFRAAARCDAVLITRGEHGMWLSGAAFEGSIPAIAREVADVTGAGDTVVATLALAMAAGASVAEAAALANHAAGIVVGKFGPATVGPDELLASVAQTLRPASAGG
ncbi:MAG TPA: D-glycero-beta-D-manno-heptose-7-phosphate kinase [Vicinamibacterales bacterium]|jgi:D-beta-D-heptose 7-phosphate kinase/D-beta-D-heptose 1-phosphate adenosyltransferase